MGSNDLIFAVRKKLANAANPNKASGMQWYMKSEMPYRGVQSPGVKSICREVFVDHPIDARAEWEQTVRTLFDDAEYREERYVAIALTGHRLYKKWQDPDALPMFERLIVTGAWWDLVDELAIRRVGPILRSHPGVVTPLLLLWSRDDDMWLRRTSIIAQVGSKLETDTDLLETCIEPSLSSKEFFLRKAIGWALREYAKVNPDWVLSYVKEHVSELSGLSKREATRHLGVIVTDE